MGLLWKLAVLCTVALVCGCVWVTGLWPHQFARLTPAERVLVRNPLIGEFSVCTFLLLSLVSFARLFVFPVLLCSFGGSNDLMVKDERWRRTFIYGHCFYSLLSLTTNIIVLCYSTIVSVIPADL